MFGMYTQFGLSSKYSYNKNWTTPYFINLISNRANFAVHGATSFTGITLNTGVLYMTVYCDWCSPEISRRRTWRDRGHGRCAPCGCPLSPSSRPGSCEVSSPPPHPLKTRQSLLLILNMLQYCRSYNHWTLVINGTIHWRISISPCVLR